MGKYVHIQDSVKVSDIKAKDFTLSSSQYKNLVLPNSNYWYVRDFLSRPLKRSDLGTEVGSLSYIDQSPYRFIRTKALQEYSFLLNLNEETALPIMPSDFISKNLKEGDLLISKDSNIGEIVILDKDYPNCMLSGAIYKLPVKEEWRYYLLAFIKHDIFREQLDFMVPQGSTIRHAKTLFLDCKIPLPTNNDTNVVKFVSLLTKTIVKKESIIHSRYNNIIEKITTELKENQLDNGFQYKLPHLKELRGINRLDAAMYTEYFKSEINKIKNYKNGYSDIEEMGFSLSRGQNLQVSNIGESIYTSDWHENFYKLVLPKYISKYGTINVDSYLGNRNKLKTLKAGDLIFGAEASGRSFVVVEQFENTITNIHGLTMQQKNHDLVKAIYIKCFLDYLLYRGLIELISVGGNGGSLAEKYWSFIPFPNFPQKKREEIALLYYNQKHYNSKDCKLDNFMDYDADFNSTAGIYELDKSAKYLKKILNKTIDDIVNNREVKIEF
ncbi:MAG: restriction endonuclease subunit S [Prevotella sp.]|nr:restriction endonuclease subunit S [Prevotella sp.]